MIPALVCRPLQYPDLTMAKATVHQLGVVSQPSLRVHCHSLSAAGYSCQRWKMSPSCWQHWHWQKSPCRAHSQLSNRMSMLRADSENHRRWQNRSRAQGLTMQWPEQDQHSQDQHSRPAAGLEGLALALGFRLPLHCYKLKGRHCSWRIPDSNIVGSSVHCCPYRSSHSRP